MQVNNPLTPQPSYREIVDYIKQTQGIVTNEILIYLGKPPIESRKDIQYKGPLTLDQQLFVLNNISNDQIKK